MHVIKIKEITLKIIIADLNQKFIDFVLHFKEVHYFKHTHNIFGFHGSFENISYNESVPCMVGAGNSFGALTGGVDLAIRNYFGKPLEELLQKTILDDYLGELPVGSAIVIPTSNKVIPYLSYSPTMRTPKVLETKDITYTATWAALTSIHRFNKHLDIPVDTIILPGMGTGTGKVPVEKAAAQMVYAAEQFFRVINGEVDNISLGYGSHIEKVLNQTY